MNLDKFLRPTATALLALAIGVLGAASHIARAEGGKNKTAPVVVASTPAPATAEIMNRFLGHMVALKKYFVSEEKFNDPANEHDIETHLQEFAQLAKEATHDPELRKENFKFSRQILERHIAETERVFSHGNKSYARWMLTSTSAICMSCHTQIPAASRSFSDFGSLHDFPSEFDQAEFLFATNAFDKAADLYEKIIKNFPDGDAKPAHVEASMAREMSFYARIKRDPAQAITKLELFLKNKRLPDSLQGNMKSWLEEFKIWKAHPDLDPATATDKQIVDFAQKTISNDDVALSSVNVSNPHLVTYLRVSGLLYQYLQSHPNTPATPKILYWLSICDRSLNNTVFYSFADLYLRECMIRFPQDPIAQKCYKEYEDETIYSYTGSSGTHIPSDVQEDLDSLKKMVSNTKITPTEH